MQKYLWVVIGSCLLWGGCAADNADVAPVNEIVPTMEQPNILVFTTDDMGYTDLGSFGSAYIPTPNLDSFATEGLRLTNFHVAISCAHTRSMLLSGTGNHEAGMGSQRVYPQFQGLSGYEGHISDRVATIPERLVTEGYHTYMSGKWHLAGRSEGNHPSDRGFERSFALLGGTGSHYGGDSVGPYSVDGQVVNQMPDDFYSTTAYVDNMIGFLESNKDDEQPFFAWFAPTAPHTPMEPHPNWINKFAGKYDAGYEALCWARLESALAAGVLPDGVDMNECAEVLRPWASLDSEAQAEQSRQMELYAAMVAHLDYEFGRLIEYLDQSGELDNTYIIYHNDNGPAGNGWQQALSSPYRGNKGDQFEGGIRVAAFMHSPYAEQTAGISNSLLTVMDVLPTILEITGVEDAYSDHETVLPIRGKSFAALLDNPNEIIHGPEEYIPLDAQSMSVLMKGIWKIVRPAGSEHWELFDTSKDPSETTDLRMDQPDIYQDLVSAYEAHAQDIGIVQLTLEEFNSVRPPGNRAQR